MIRQSFNTEWVVGPKVSPFAALGGRGAEPQPVTLPHAGRWSVARGRNVP
jgi:hypothetical protein